MMRETIATLQQLFDTSAGSADQHWLHSSVKRLMNASDIELDFGVLSASTRQKITDSTLEPGTKIQVENGYIDAGYWLTSDLARTLLLLQAIQANPANESVLVRAAYQYGDELEKSALLKSLSIIDNSSNYMAIALDAGRSNSEIIFSAIFSGNPYPRLNYSEAEIIQLVLKALFLELNLDTLQGLAGRLNPRLSEKCARYVEERQLADRSFPPSIWLAIRASDLEDKLAQRFLSDMQNPEVIHRYYALLSLQRNGEIPHSFCDVIDILRTTEADPAILDLLETF